LAFVAAAPAGSHLEIPTLIYTWPRGNSRAPALFGRKRRHQCGGCAWTGAML